MKHWSYLFLLALIGCKGLNEDKVSGRYFLQATDYENASTSLNFRLDNGDSYGVVKEMVFGIGYNDQYIIVKQHPRKFPNQPDTTITNYYIIKPYKENTLWAEKGVLGPFTSDQFKEERKRLNISDELAFTREIEKLK